MPERTKYSETIEKRLAQIQAKAASPETEKKRNFSRIILLINIVLLVGVFFFAENMKRQPEQYNEQKVAVAGITYSFSAVTSTKGYIFSLTLASSEKREIIFKPKTVSVNLCVEGSGCTTRYFPTSDEPLVIDNGSSESLYLTIEHPSDSRRPSGLTYFFTKKRRVDAKLLISGDPEISLEIDL